MSYNRRDFIRNSSKIIAGSTLLAGLPLDYVAGKTRKVGPNDKVRIALIGCKGMGWSNLTAHLRLPDVECVALCDVDENVLSQRADELKKKIGKEVKLYKDFRKLLENKDIDAVIIATPDHWHCLITVMACEAGKDVYVEKPLGNSIGECAAMVSAKQKYNRVVQVGQWQRSNLHWKEAIDYVQNGKIGKVRNVKCWAYIGWKSELPIQPDEPVPPGVDYDMWLGPAPKHAFNKNRFHFNFRWYWDYAGGLMTDWGVHLLDMAILGMKVQAPKSVMSTGGKYAYPKDAMQTPDTQTAIFEYNDFSISWEHAVGIYNGLYGKDHGVAFIGNLGTLVVNRQGWEILPEPEGKHFKTEAIPKQNIQDDGLNLHTANFIECIKNRSQAPACSIEMGANTATIAHMGNIAYRTGNKIYWDPAKKLFLNNQEANKLITPAYREPWKFPTI